MSLRVSQVEDKVRAAIRTGEIAPFLSRLIQFASVNPPGEEEGCALFIADKLRSMGLEVSLPTAVDHRPNVVAVWRGTGGGRSLLIYGGHSDVVPPGNRDLWEDDPFSGKVTADRVYGRGASDHKGSIASSIYALQAFIESGTRLKGDVVYTVPCDEETLGRKGAEFLVDQRLVYGDQGIYAAPTGNRVIAIASKGILVGKITVFGRQGHSNSPWKALNPIPKAAKLVEALHAMQFTKTDAVFPEDVGGPRGLLSVTMINAGVKFNLIPAQCDLVFDRRLIPAESPEEARMQVQEVLDRCAREDPEFRADLEVIDTDRAVAISPDEPIVRSLAQRTLEVIGRSPRVAGIAGTADVRYFTNKGGIPMAIFGPGGYTEAGGKLSHAPNEYVPIRELVEAAHIYALMMLDICSAS